MSFHCFFPAYSGITDDVAVKNSGWYIKDSWPNEFGRWGGAEERRADLRHSHVNAPETFEEFRDWVRLVPVPEDVDVR